MEYPVAVEEKLSHGMAYWGWTVRCSDSRGTFTATSHQRRSSVEAKVRWTCPFDSDGKNQKHDNLKHLKDVLIPSCLHPSAIKCLFKSDHFKVTSEIICLIKTTELNPMFNVMNSHPTKITQLFVLISSVSRIATRNHLQRKGSTQGAHLWWHPHSGISTLSKRINEEPTRDFCKIWCFQGMVL